MIWTKNGESGDTGDGCSFGDGFGDGFGYGRGQGIGGCRGFGYGDGYGNGHGDGNGQGGGCHVRGFSNGGGGSWLVDWPSHILVADADEESCLAAAAVEVVCP